MNMEQIEELIIRLVSDVRNQAFYEHNNHDEDCGRKVWLEYAQRIKETKVRLSEDHGINIP